MSNQSVSKIWTVTLLTVTALLAASCSPPQESIDAAQAALTEAEALDPAAYAPEAWEQAQQAMAALNAELETQSQKFALFRSYSNTEQLVENAQQAASAAKEAANAGREQARDAAQSALADTTSALDSAQAALDALQQCKRKPKGFAADVERLTAMLDGLRAQLPEVAMLMTEEDFLGARSRAEALLAEANGLVTELNDAKVKLGC